MASWRDSVPDDVRTDIETVLALLQQQGAEALEGDAGVAPYAIAVEGEDPPTEYYPVSVEVARSGRNRSETMIDELVKGLREDRDRWRVAGIGYDVTLDTGQSALCLDVEHRAGHGLKVLAPYKRGRLRGGIRFSGGEATDLEPRIWA